MCILDTYLQILFFIGCSLLFLVLFSSPQPDFVSNFDVPNFFRTILIVNIISVNTLMNLGYIILLFSSNYVPSDYKCTNTDISQWLVRDSNKSFPSGHASMSTYTAVFMMVSLSLILNISMMLKDCVFQFSICLLLI